MDAFKTGLVLNIWPGQVRRSYTVKLGYLWLLGARTHQPWGAIIWNRRSLPRHTFTAWLFFHQRVPVRHRITKFNNQIGEVLCGLCNEEEETLEHLFLSCTWAREFWQLLSQWWPIPRFNPTYASFFRALKRMKRSQKQKHITYAMVAAALYQIWRARNTNVLNHILL